MIDGLTSTQRQQHRDSTSFYYDGWNLIEEDNSSGTTARYIYGPGTDELAAMWSNGNWSWYHYDAPGSW